VDLLRPDLAEERACLGATAFVVADLPVALDVGSVVVEAAVGTAAS